MPNNCKWIWVLPSAVVAAFITGSCSPTKYVPEGKYLLKSSVVKTDNKGVDAKALAPYMRQHPNSKWFSLFKIPLGIYNLSGRDSTKWGNLFLRRLGEEPVVFDTLQVALSCNDMNNALQGMGYLNSSVTSHTKYGHKRANVEYSVKSGQLFTLDSVSYTLEDTTLQNVIRLDNVSTLGLKRGMAFSIENLDKERARLTNILTNEGFFKFNKDFIHFDVDTLGKRGMADITLRLIKYRGSNNSIETNHRKYFINNVTFSGNAGEHIPLRNKVLKYNSAIEEGQCFSSSNLQRTYNNFARLQAVRFTNIHFIELPDTNLLDCNIQISTRKPNSVTFQPEGTNTAGDLGAAVSLTYENNNLFRGSELFSIQLRGAFEAITGLEGYQNQNYFEYNIESKLNFPRIIAPFLSKNFKRRQTLKSELLVSYNLQNRPEFHRRVFTSAWRYLWKNAANNTSYRFDLIDINYVHMPWISHTFKENYLDDASNRNAILKYNYEDLFILRTGFGISYNRGNSAIRSNLELGGNVLNALSHMLGSSKNTQGQYTLFNIAYAQYVKGDFDFTRLVNIDSKNTLALHFGLGLAYPYGNSYILPFEKRYFSGGSNSVRGWNVRELGPGKFKGTDGRIDFINQTGDMKLDINAEWRTYLFWKFNGAFFVDAGNIWTLKNYSDQPGGQFKFDEVYKQIAVSYGLGLRMNFDYFVLRLDLGIKAINPAYDNKRQHYPLLYPDFSRDCALHFAVGMPF